jgi:hypothetical protein
VVSIPPVPPHGPPHGPDDQDDPTGIRALLSGMPDPGPMPADLVERINASIAAEQAARAGSRGLHDLNDLHDLHGPVVVPLRRHRRWQRLGLAAAVAAVAAVGVPALLTSGGSSWIASLTTTNSAASDSAAGSAERGPAASSSAQPKAPSAAGVTIYASGTAYTSSGFSSQVRAFVDRRGTPLAPLAAEAPAIGPAGTPLGIAPCLSALKLDPSAQVSADLGTFDGAPAIIVLASTDTSQTAYAVGRGCTAGATTVLTGPVRVS